MTDSRLQINWGKKSLAIAYADLAILVLCVLYVVGILGLTLPIHPDFVSLTPINLLVSLIIILFFHNRWDRNSILFICLAYLIGFGSEVLGVQTGILFGDYIYGPVLGPKLWDTPLMIGVNWVILAYSSGMLINQFLPEKSSAIWKALLASITMVILDILIEPVAMQLNFWQWPDQAGPPIHNFLGWWLVSFVILNIFMQLLPNRKNKVAIALLSLQFLFFILLNIL